MFSETVVLYLEFKLWFFFEISVLINQNTVYHVAVCKLVLTGAAIEATGKTETHTPTDLVIFWRAMNATSVGFGGSHLPFIPQFISCGILIHTCNRGWSFHVCFHSTSQTWSKYNGLFNNMKCVWLPCSLGFTTYKVHGMFTTESKRHRELKRLIIASVPIGQKFGYRHQKHTYWELLIDQTV